jgi:pyridoxamine 5'-phosphate oxidase
MTAPDREASVLSERDVDPDPMRQFEVWFADARAARLAQPEAMALATATRDGRPSVRMVLLKGVDRRGFVFYTNAESRKGAELASNPRAALAVYWEPLHRQVRATGPVERLSAAESDAYFASRPRGAQLAAAASAQSRSIAGRDELTAAYRRVEAEFDGVDVPRPDHWGGFRLVPDEVEFWHGRENRLHDRVRYTRTAATAAEGPVGPADATASVRAWRVERLAP